MPSHVALLVLAEEALRSGYSWGEFETISLIAVDQDFYAKSAANGGHDPEPETTTLAIGDHLVYFFEATPEQIAELNSDAVSER